MTFQLPSLNYGYEALEPHIDGTTMTIHHTKHHNTYVTKMNAAVGACPELGSMDLLTLNQKIGTSEIPADQMTNVRNNGGGHWNHSFFWTVLAPPSSTNGPSSELKAAIDGAFGSMDEMKSKFNAAAAGRFGSGWAWLGVEEGGKLTITSTANQDNPLMANVVDQACIPVLGLDVWEHAYYLKYQNKRPEYIQNFWSVVNWEAVNGYYAEATQGKAPKL
ncbi:superoxide dismutase [Chloropicon primus]|uniref:Superoxide dismutase n=1 Tax=Chloropicon primus TaxID=1764295 RepID=A0A5B8MZ13_9CHLO|nr:superoxide dismutase [Chloropicon primus]UPR05062.1 superoxide dismutase [Chloropicon primus]|eukprot:QDZ25867.1 superoxide dismutase [Chloropicon primus]